jgi:hypothetical protein
VSVVVWSCLDIHYNDLYVLPERLSLNAQKDLMCISEGADDIFSLRSDGGSKCKT